MTKFNYGLGVFASKTVTIVVKFISHQCAVGAARWRNRQCYWRRTALVSLHCCLLAPEMLRCFAEEKRKFRINKLATFGVQSIINLTARQRVLTEFTGIRELPNVSTQKWLKTCSSPPLPQSFVSAPPLNSTTSKHMTRIFTTLSGWVNYVLKNTFPIRPRLDVHKLSSARKLNIDFVVKQEKFFNLFLLVWRLVLSFWSRIIVRQATLP